MDHDIRDLVFGLRKSINDIDAQLKIIEKSDIFKENEELIQKNVKLSARNKKIENDLQQFSSDNAALKNALYEQYFNEKVNTVSKTLKNIEIFFANEVNDEINRLTRLENSIKQRLEQMTKSLADERRSIEQESYAKLQNLQDQIFLKISEVKQKAAEISVSEDEKAEMKRLKEESLTSEQITELSRKNNFEKYVGLNILNTVGIILFIIGAIAAGQFGYIWVSFALGAGFLVAGEFMNRKKPNIFSLGITAGGVGILYTSLAIGHFVHEIIGMYPALGICIAITVLAFYLSTRYKSETLLAIALVGGYLPILSILLDGSERTLLFGMMAYFVLFNLLALSLSFRNKWTTASFVGLSLNIVGTIFILSQVNYSNPDRIIGLVYVIFATMVYKAIPLVSTFLTKSKFRISDLVLISINAFFGSLIMFIYIYSFRDWFEYLGLAAAIYAAVYLGASYLIAKKFEGENRMSGLFFIAGIVFAFAFIPFEFNIEWFVPGTVLLAVIITILGIIYSKRTFLISGLSIGGISLAWLFLYDTTTFLYYDDTYFTIQYASITAAGIAVLAAFVLKKNLYNGFQKVFKYFTAINLWIFALYMCSRLWHVLVDAFPDSLFSLDYLIGALVAAVTLFFGKLYQKIPFLADKNMKLIGTSLSFLALIIIFTLNISTNPIGGEIPLHPTNVVVVATFILLAVEFMGIYTIYDITRRAVLSKIMGIQYLPLVVSTYIVIVFTTTLTIDYGLNFASFWISAIYAATALLWTVLGFVRRYSLLRRFGLALALFSVIKLFLFDLQFLTTEFRILSYFIMGAVLVAISFVYQYFSKRLEIKN